MLALSLAVTHLALAALSPAPADVYRLDEAAFLAQAKRDLALLQQHARGLERLEAQVREHEALYRQGEREPYSPEQKHTLLSTWAALSDYLRALEGIRLRYARFLAQSPRSRGPQHAWGFVLTHTALTVQLAHGLAYAERTTGRRQLEVLLDEPGPRYGLEPGTFARFKARVVHVSATTQLHTGDAYREQLLPLFTRVRLLDDPLAREALGLMRRESERARALLARRGVTLFARAGTDVMRDVALGALFPVQKGVAAWMGDTRVRRVGQPLIARRQAEALLPRLRPGDILVARQNWFLSNVGLPGFWPHAELYVGTPAELARAFDADPAVQAWLATLPGRPTTLAAHLARAYPEAWARYTRPDPHGDTVRVLESISEGVSFTGLTHAMGVDYLAALRPRLGAAEKAQALARAFGYAGRPYDFDFDFFSDATLVCSELVFKAYQPGEGMRGLRIPLVEVAGRMTLPPNELVRQFDQELGTAAQQLDFVAFLDGRERQRDAVERDVAAFRASHARLKWDVAQR